MLKATVTVRELKNKDTGIDVSIPTYQEIPGLISNTVEFHAVIVTALRCFKSPKQKDDDVVQFMIKKKPNEFEELHAKLNKKYSATVLPPLPKKTLFSDLTLQELRAGYEQFLQFLSVTPKLCACQIFTEFLGVDHAKAEKLTDAEERSPSSPEDIEDIFEEHQPRRMSDTKPTEKSTSKPKKPDIFGENNADDDIDLFTAKPAAKDDDGLDLLALAAAADERAGKGKEKEEVKMGKPKPIADTKLFDDQDYGGGIDREEADKIFYIPSSEPSEKDSAPLFEVEDNSDLLTIEDDLDKLLTAELPSCKKAKPVITEKPHTSSKPDPPETPLTAELASCKKAKPVVTEKPHTSSKPDHPETPLTAELPLCEKAKPMVTEKPHTSSKPDPPETPLTAELPSCKKAKPVVTEKPHTSSKPDPPEAPLTAELPSCKKAKPVITEKPHTSSKPDPPEKPQFAPKPSSKPVLAPKPGKPALKPKPGAKPKTTPSGDADDLFSQDSKKSDDLDADDIMKYIQDNADDTEVDLFS